jgi:regulatory protein YycH of two-component signal transduction system YycFG
MKLIKYYDGDSIHLYNLKQDISEQNNLAEELSETRDALLQKIADFINDTGAKLPVVNE